MDPLLEPIQRSAEKTMNIILDIQEKKDKDYNGSFTKSLNEDGILVAKIRMNDKINRIDALVPFGNNQVKDESLEDSMKDLVAYALMTLQWLQGTITKDKAKIPTMRELGTQALDYMAENPYIGTINYRDCVKSLMSKFTNTGQTVLACKKDIFDICKIAMYNLHFK